MDYRYTDTPSQLAELIRHLEGCARAGLDTEANSLYRYTPSVCFIQVNLGGTNFLLDPLAGLDLDPFFAALTGKELILHDGDYDLRMLRSTFGFDDPGPVFDTKLAAEFAGHGSLGLVAVIEQLLGEKLTKQGQKSDWTLRPLTAKQLEYACNDVHYLEPLAQILAAKLDELDRAQWHAEACQRMVRNSMADSPKNNVEAWRIRGAGSLKRKELHYLYHLWHWRDREAREADVPLFRVLSNQVLQELAGWAALQEEPSLSNGPRLPRNCSGRRLARLRAKLRQARRAPRDQWPPLRERKPRPREIEGMRPLVRRLQEECAAVAEGLGLAPSLLAPRTALEAVARLRPKGSEALVADCGMLQWQAVLLEPVLPKVYAEHPLL